MVFAAHTTLPLECRELAPAAGQERRCSYRPANQPRRRWHAGRCHHPCEAENPIPEHILKAAPARFWKFSPLIIGSLRPQDEPIALITSRSDHEMRNVAKTEGEYIWDDILGLYKGKIDVRIS